MDVEQTKKQTTTWEHFDNGKLKTLVTKNGAGAVTESHEVGYVDDAGHYVNGNRTTDQYVLARADGNTSATTCLAAAPCSWLTDRSSRSEDVEVGDKVLATDPETGKTEAREVVALIVGEGDKDLVEVTVDTDGAAGDEEAYSR